MAYHLEERFPQPPKYYALLDPTVYQYEKPNLMQSSKAPFLSNTPRKTQVGTKLWTEAIYDATMPRKIIPNCTALLSKLSRFPHEYFIKGNSKTILCECRMSCDCFTEEIEDEVVCQGRIKRRLFKGPPPRTVLSEDGLSVPSRRYRGFAVLPDGSKRRLKQKVLDESPKFYDTRLKEYTLFYRGCKWSQRTSKRSQKPLEVRPGPADYTIEREPTDAEICSEKVREYKRRTSKQPRFIEIIQQKNISDGSPGPSTYSPNLPKGINIKFLGPKSVRFPESLYEIRPGPADYLLRRDFDPVDIPEKPCQAKLPKPSCFGVKALRFKPRHEDGPGPATYGLNFKPCQVLHCQTAAFSSSAKRFKENEIDEEDDTFSDNLPQNADPDDNLCPNPTWEFKSKTIRMKPLMKKYDEPSPADVPQSRIKLERPRQMQYASPFNSSEGRFQPWYNWMPVHGKEKTPGPCYYSLEKPKCLPAVSRGPLCHALRFSSRSFDTPSPNEYKVGGGIEIILRTRNQRLLNNIENQHKFNWEPPQAKRNLTWEERGELLLQKSIALLEGDLFDDLDEKPARKKESFMSKKVKETQKPKLLRCFLYKSQIPTYF